MLARLKLSCRKFVAFFAASLLIFVSKNIQATAKFHLQSLLVEQIHHCRIQVDLAKIYLIKL